MKTWKKRLALSVTIGLAATALAACGSKKDDGAKTDGSDSKGDEKVTLKVSTWDYANIPEFKALFDAFHEKYPNVTVEAVDIPSADYDTKLTTMLASGDTTDILTMKNLLSYSNYALRDQLMDVTDHLKDLDTKPAQDSFDMYSIDGKTYAQPYRTDFWVLYYNKQMFKDAGIADPDNMTWEEYQAAAEKMAKPDEQVYGTYQHVWRSTIQAIAAAQNDKNLLDPSYDFMEPYYERALALQDEQAQMDFGTAKSTKVTYQSQFEGAKAGMAYMGTWWMGGILTKQDNGEIKDFDWGIAPMPQNEKDGKITTFGSPTAFAVNKKAAHAKEAQDFLDFCSGKEGAEILANVGVVPSYRTDEINEIYFNRKGMPNDEISQKAFNPDKIAVEFPVDKKGPAIDKILQEEHDLIMTGDKTPAEGIKEMEKRVKDEIGD